MNDIVVTTMVQMLAQAGVTTARFNFRSGVNRGISSMNDIIVVANALLNQTKPPKHILLIGYSYGSMVAMGAVKYLAPYCIGLVLISPPVDYGWALFLYNHKLLIDSLTDFEGPIFMMVGNQDQFCSQKSFQSLSTSQPNIKALQISDTDHFNIYQHAVKHISSWVLDTFQLTELSQLADHSNL